MREVSQSGPMADGLEAGSSSPCPQHLGSTASSSARGLASHLESPEHKATTHSTIRRR